MTIQFSGAVWYWKGPAPHYFATLPAGEADRLRAVLSSITYGWGMVPVQASIGGSEWPTSLFPKDGGYILPIKLSVRKAEGIEEGDTVSARLELR